MRAELMTGGCLCGEVTYRSSAKPDFSIICFCTDCQKLSGGGHLPQCRVAKDSVAFSGSISTHSVVSDSAADVEIGFCSACGTTLYKASSRFPDKMFLTVGSMDDPTQFAPDMRVHEASKQPWDIA